MKILVTGSAGFVSWHLCNRLLSEGHTVFGIDNFISGQKKNIEDLQRIGGDRFQFLEGDIVDAKTDEWVKSLPKLDQIFHMACPASPPIYQIDPLHTLNTCYVGTRNVFHWALNNGARALYASTSECYGDPEVHPQPESYRGNVNTFGPRACYDEGKRVGEALAYAFQEKGAAIRIARIFNTYGPRMAPGDGRVMTNFMVQALAGEPLTLYGNGQQTRSFCYVDDLVEGLVALIHSEEPAPTNLGSPFEFTVEAIADMIIELTSSKSTKVFVDLPVDDPKVRRPDTTKAEKVLNWRAQIHPTEGLAQMLNELNENLKSLKEEKHS